MQIKASFSTLFSFRTLSLLSTTTRSTEKLVSLDLTLQRLHKVKAKTPIHRLSVSRHLVNFVMRFIGKNYGKRKDNAERKVQSLKTTEQSFGAEHTNISRVQKAMSRHEWLYSLT